jgi:peroxiredoxin Q/BCP
MLKSLCIIMGIINFLGTLGRAEDAQKEPLDVGAMAPAVTALDQNGKEVVFADLYKKGVVLVYFYPKSDTPGCTMEACSLRDAFDDLAKKGIQVVGVSADKVEKQKAFEEKYKLPFIIIADPDKKVISAFGVPALKGFAARQSFLIKDGKIVWRALKASTKEQAADVLKAFSELK